MSITVHCKMSSYGDRKSCLHRPIERNNLVRQSHVDKEIPSLKKLYLAVTNDFDISDE